MIAVTTFPSWAWDIYAKYALDSFLRFWPIPILVYCESPPPLSSDRVGVRPLSGLGDLQDFLAFDGPPKPQEIYMWEAKRFSNKVFAQLDALQDHDRVIWLDADVITRETVPQSVLDFVTDDFVTFLGRKGSYTETGFIGFNRTQEGFAEFADRYRRAYAERTIYDLPFWTDCHAFDFARKDKGHNLTPDGRGMDDVFAKSVLGEYMTHYKGKRKKHIYRGGDIATSFRSVI